MGYALILTQFPRVLVSETLSACIVTHVLSACALYITGMELHFPNPGEKLTVISVVKLCGAACW